MGEHSWQAQESVGIMGRTLQSLEEQARDPEPAERLEALRLLATHAPLEGLPALDLAKDDPDPTVRRYARQEAAKARALAGDTEPAVGFEVPRIGKHPLDELRITLKVHIALWTLSALVVTLQLLFSRRTGDLLSVVAIPHRWPVVELGFILVAWGALKSLSDKRSFDAIFFMTLAAVCCAVTYPLGFILGPWILYRTWRPKA